MVAVHGEHALVHQLVAHELAEGHGLGLALRAEDSHLLLDGCVFGLNLLEHPFEAFLAFGHDVHLIEPAHRPRKARVPVSSIESSIPRDQMPYSVHTAARPADRTSMAEILIRDIREAAISSAITPIKDDLLKERQELQRQQSFSEPYQAES